jgi:hypothetical protein
MAGSCECGDEPSGSGATELVSYNKPTTHNSNLPTNQLGFISVGSSTGT